MMKRYEADKAAPPAPPTPPAATPPAAPPVAAHTPAEPPRLPGSDGKKEEEEKARMQRDSQAIQYQQLQQEVAALKYAAAKAESERIIVQLEAEGFRINRATEVERMARMEPAARTEREKEIRENYQRAPIGTPRGGQADGFVRTQPGAGPGGPKNLDRAGFERAQKYQREKRCTWEEAVQHELGTGA